MNCKYCGAAIDLKDIPAPQPISIDAVTSGRPTMGQPVTRRNAVSKVKKDCWWVFVLFFLLPILGCNGASISEASLSQEEVAATQAAVVPAKVGEDVRVDEVRWHVLSAEDLGDTLSSDNRFVDSKTTAGRFIRVRFEIENLSNDLLTYGGLDLVDNRDREYTSYSESFMFLPDEEECSFIENLNPNIPKICTVIYEVAADAAGLKIVASDLKIFGSDEKEIDLGLD